MANIQAFKNAVNQTTEKGQAFVANSTADIAMSSGTVIGFVFRAGQPITGKFGQYVGKQIVKAQTITILRVDTDRAGSTIVPVGGRLESNWKEVDWRTCEWLDEMEANARAILGDSVYDAVITAWSRLNMRLPEVAAAYTGLAESLEQLAGAMPEDVARGARRQAQFYAQLANAGK